MVPKKWSVCKQFHIYTSGKVVIGDTRKWGAGEYPQSAIAVCGQFCL